MPKREVTNWWVPVALQQTTRESCCCYCYYYYFHLAVQWPFVEERSMKRASMRFSLCVHSWRFGYHVVVETSRFEMPARRLRSAVSRPGRKIGSERLPTKKWRRRSEGALLVDHEKMTTTVAAWYYGYYDDPCCLENAKN